MYMGRKAPLFTVDFQKLEQAAREHLIKVATEGMFDQLDKGHINSTKHHNQAHFCMSSEVRGSAPRTLQTAEHSIGGVLSLGCCETQTTGTLRYVDSFEPGVNSRSDPV